MTAAQIVHFFILIGLGILAFLTFVVAGTILGLMMVEDGCRCVQYPIGLFVLGIFWALLLISLVRELIDSPVFSLDWLKNNQEVMIVALIILLAILVVI